MLSKNHKKKEVTIIDKKEHLPASEYTLFIHQEKSF
jgi:hypothetical protein